MAVTVEAPNRPDWMSEENWIRIQEEDERFAEREKESLRKAFNSPFAAVRKEALSARTAKIILHDRWADDRVEDERFVREHPDQKPPAFSLRTADLLIQGAGLDYTARFSGKGILGNILEYLRSLL